MEEYRPMCEVQDLEEHWNNTQSNQNNNVRRRYVSNPKKHKQLKLIDMGTFCVMNDITPDMLRLFVEYGKKLFTLIAKAEADHQPKDDNVVVFMSKEDYEQYEEYKKFKAFKDSQK